MLDAAVLSRRASAAHLKVAAPVVLAGLAFAVLYWDPIVTLGRDWWRDSDASHGLLLGPIAVVLAWRRGIVPDRRPQYGLGIALILGAVLLRYLSGLAAELFTMRLSLFAAAGGLIVFAAGIRQLLHWWLPIALLLLSIPIPSVVLNTVAFPLQLQASEMGAALLEWRRVPVYLAGNIIHLPGQSLFVTEACSGLRSLTALLALGLLMGGMWLRTTWARSLLVAVTIPVTMVVNGVRVFLTGFLVYYVDPSLGKGFMHFTEGWALFVLAFVVLSVVSMLFGRIERMTGRSAA
jgi:exosortase